MSDRICITCGTTGGACRWSDDPVVCMRGQITALTTRIAELERDPGMWKRIAYDKQQTLFRVRAALDDPISTGGQAMTDPYLIHAKISVGEVEFLRAQVAKLESLINTPQTNSWFDGVRLEAAHQQERWGSDHDMGKTAFDWFWLIGYLAQKAASSSVTNDIEKAKHHTISTAAALLNWHRALTGERTAMRPGITPPEDKT